MNSARYQNRRGRKQLGGVLNLEMRGNLGGLLHILSMQIWVKRIKYLIINSRYK